MTLLLRRAGWVLGSLAGCTILAFGLAGVRWSESNLRVRKRPPEPAPSSAPLDRLGIRWQAVQISARDGARLHAWLLRSKSTEVGCVIALHGLGEPRTDMLGLAPMFLSQGYCMLTPDNRALGESGGEIVTYGVREVDDVHRWVYWLETSQHPGNLFGFGESLGAAVLLQSLRPWTRFNAVVADSTLSELSSVAGERLERRIPLPWAVAHAGAGMVVAAGFTYAWLRYGVNLRSASVLEAIRFVRTPILLIHGAKDTRTPVWHSKLLAAENPGSVELWVVPGAEHVESIVFAPDEYRRRVLGWFADHVRQAQP